jgi:hypothetical protein
MSGTATAWSPFRPLTTCGISLLLIALVLVITAAARPAFISFSGGGGVGAFELCLPLLGLPVCFGLKPNTECSPDLPGTVTGSLAGCDLFNSFRGVLVGGIVLLGFCNVAAVFVTLTGRSRSRLWQGLNIAVGVVSTACIATSLFCFVGWWEKFGSDGINVPGSSYASSFYLVIATIIAVITGVALFTVGSRREGPASASSPQNSDIRHYQMM